ncbi:uncharacterized protein LOC144703154 [Wolffia australiana]
MSVAAAFGGFSIREFTALIRNRDVEKCWPFGGDAQEATLPSIECPKHRWWCAELQAVRSAVENKNEVIRHADDKYPTGLQEEPRSSKIPEKKIRKRKCAVEVVAEASLVDILNECENCGKDEMAIVGPSPQGGQEERDALNQSKKRKKERCRFLMAKRTEKDSDVVIKKTGEKLQPGQKRCGRGKRDSSAVDGNEERKFNSELLPSTELPQLQSGLTVKRTRKERMNKEFTGLAEHKGEKHTKARKRRNFQKIEGSTLLSSHNHQDETDAPVDLVTVQATDPDKNLSVINGTKAETTRDDQEDYHMSKSRSPSLQSLYRVFSSALAASNSTHKTSADENKCASRNLNCDNDQLSALVQTSGDENVLMRLEGSSRSQKSVGFGEMVDLNNPIEICSSQFEALTEVFTASRKEGDVIIQEDSITQGSPSDENEDIIPRPNSQPLQQNFSFISPASAEKRTFHAESKTSSKLLNAVERREVSSFNGDSNAPGSEQGKVNAINQSRLTGELFQRSRETLLENGSSRDVLNGPPVSLKRELIPDNTHHPGSSQEARMNNKQAPTPYNTLPEHNFIEKSSPYQPSWKAPEQWFLDRRQDSAGNNGQCTITQNAIGNPSKSFAFNSNPRNTSYAGENLSHAFLSSTSEPSTVRLMGTNVMIGRNSSNHPCSWKVKERFNESTAVAGSRPSGHEMFESYFYGGANEVSTSISPYAGAQFRSNLVMNAGSKDLFHRNDRQPANVTPDQFIPSERLTRHHFSNDWPGQGLILRNLASPNILSGERSSRNLHLSSGNDLPSTSAYLTSKQLTRWPIKEVRDKYSEADILCQLATHGVPFAAFRSTDVARRVTSTVSGAEPLERSEMEEKLAAFQSFSMSDPRKVVSLSGSVKLSAGARHVLKDGRRVVNKDKPLAVQPTVPFPRNGGSRNVPVAQEKSRMI